MDPNPASSRAPLADQAEGSRYGNVAVAPEHVPTAGSAPLESRIGELAQFVTECGYLLAQRRAEFAQAHEALNIAEGKFAKASQELTKALVQHEGNNGLIQQPAPKPY